MSLVISAKSLEYIRVPVTATESGVLVNPTTDVAKMAFMQSGAAPTAGDFKTASWETEPGPKYLVRCLVGTGGAAVLTAGTYTVWVQITDSPEVPIRQVGQLVVT